MAELVTDIGLESLRSTFPNNLSLSIATRSASWSTSSNIVSWRPVVPSLLRRRISSQRHTAHRVKTGRRFVKKEHAGFMDKCEQRSGGVACHLNRSPHGGHQRLITRRVEEFAGTLMLCVWNAIEHRLKTKSSVPVINGSMAASCRATPITRRTASASVSMS